MEAFSLLKYWRGGGGGGGGLPPPSSAADTTATTAILTAVAQNDSETDDDNDSNGDDGPFFDLEFTVPDEPDDSEDGHENPNDNHSAEEEEENDDVVVDDDNNEECEGEREFKFTLSPSTSNERSDPNLSVSDDLFFKGKLVHLDLNSSEPNSKPQSSLLKSATKFRVFMLGLKKSKSNITSSSSSHKHKESNASDSVAPNPKKQQQRKLFTVKFKVEEVPIMSLFTRDNKASQNKKHNTEEETQSPSSSASDEKRLHKYLKMVKPLYVRVSRRYAEKLRFSGQLNITSSSKTPAPAPAEKEKEKEKAQTETDASETANVKGQKQGNLALPAGLRVVCKHLGKSRSASSAPPAVVSAPAPAPLASSRRRDDSLLQQQDGIQGAILHCKRSFNASRGCESSQLPRSVSDPLHEISPELSRKSTNEGKNKRL